MIIKTNEREEKISLFTILFFRRNQYDDDDDLTAAL